MASTELLEALRSLSPQVILLTTALLVLFLKILSESLSNYSHYIGIVGTALALSVFRFVESDVVVSGFVVDQFGLLGTGLLETTLIVVLVYSIPFLRKTQSSPTEWTFLLICATLGLTLLYNTYNLILLFVGLELSSLAFYVLCGYLREDPRSLEASLKYFVLGSVGSAILLLGIALVFVNQRTLVVTEFTGASGRVPVGFLMGLGVVFLGFLFKLSVVPLQFWVPDVYEGAPTPVTAYMSVAVKIGVLGAFIRILSHVLGLGALDLASFLWWASAVTIVFGNLLALVQNSLKRMLAYSSIAHAGYLLLGLVALDVRGYTAILFYLAVYLLMNLLVFGVIGFIESDEDQYQFDDLKGLSETRPVLAASLVLAMVSLVGLPPTGGFMGKLFLFYGVVQAGYSSLAVIAVLGSVVSVAYYFRVIVYSYMKTPVEEDGAVRVRSGFLSTTTVALSALLILYLGISPSFVYNKLFVILEGLK